MGDMREGVDADGGDVQFAASGAFVERLDVLQDVLKTKAVRVEPILRQRIKHEGVIGIRRVAERQSLCRHARALWE